MRLSTAFSVRAVVVLNLHSYGSGRNPWGTLKPEYLEKVWDSLLPLVILHAIISFHFYTNQHVLLLYEYFLLNINLSY